jgi:predicted glycoside hydrolase/deacetylase ChbG (UPF0249 family)
VTSLIINADDFGLTAGVNRAIVELHRAGVVTSATLMARAPATEDAVRIACSTPSLGVGCHVVLVDGKPVLLPLHDIPHLAESVHNQFRRSLAGFLGWLYIDPRHRFSSAWAASREIEAEAAAQIRTLQDAGLHLTHIDTHKHTHMFPAVLRPLLRAARAAGIRAVRNPFEPVWSLRASPRAPWLRRAQVNLLRLLEPAFRRIVADEGFTTTSGSIGILATGMLEAATISSLLQSLPAGTWELVAHPGYNDPDLARAHTRLLASRETDRDALSTVLQFPSIDLISFADLQTHSEDGSA